MRNIFSTNTPQKIAQSDLTGVYRCNDGGTYYFCRVANLLLPPEQVALEAVYGLAGKQS
jgi:hypothetical protein